MRSTSLLAVVSSILLVVGATVVGSAQPQAPQAGQPEKPAAEKAAPAKPGVKAKPSPFPCTPVASGS